MCNAMELVSISTSTKRSLQARCQDLGSGNNMWSFGFLHFVGAQANKLGVHRFLINGKVSFDGLEGKSNVQAFCLTNSENKMLCGHFSICRTTGSHCRLILFLSIVV